MSAVSKSQVYDITGLTELLNKNSNVKIIVYRLKNKVDLIAKQKPRRGGLVSSYMDMDDVSYSLNIAYKVELGSNNSLYIIKNSSTNEFEILNISNKQYIEEISGFSNFISRDNITNIAFLKLKGYEQSANLFKYGPLKKEMYETNSYDEIYNKELSKGKSEDLAKKLAIQANHKKYNFNEILIDYKTKEDGIIRNLVTVISNTGRAVKFVINEVEFVFPDFNKILKGYTPAKDRTIEKGKKFIVKNNKGFKSLPVGVEGVIKKVSEVKTSRNNRYLTAIIDNKEYTLTKKNIKII